MNNKTAVVLCAGGGIADVGIKRAGYEITCAIEYDEDIAGVYAANHGEHVLVADIRDVHFEELLLYIPRPDLIWASPPCPSFSVAKTGRGETETDLEIADAVVRAITTLRPAAVVVENVRGYAVSESFRRIRAALDALDYWSDAEVVNAADLGTPQTRERLILRARAGGWMQAHRPWPAPVPWRGWYTAIADLVPTLPESAFAPWQLARLPAEIKESMLMMSNVSGFERAEVGQGWREPSRPAATVPAEPTGGMPRAFIVDGQPSDHGGRVAVPHGDAPMLTVHAQMGARHATRAWLLNQNESDNGRGGTYGVTARREDEPSTTVKAAVGAGWYKAFLVQGTSTLDIRDANEPSAAVLATVQSKAAMPRATLPPGRVVAFTPRCLARFQGLPDTYWLPEKKSLACRVVGNGVAVEVAEAAARSLL